jgi:2-phosphosulfolactate phosphatase
MEIEVAFLPTLLSEPRQWVCVVVDVLRASTSLATMFGRGLEEAVIAGSVDEARRLATVDGYLLCGERNGLPPAGFDHGNSPVEFSRLDLIGRRAVFVSSNGTRAMHLCAESPALLVGSLVNAATVARVACQEADRLGVGIAFVCAGNDYGRQFSLDDAVACGLLVQAVEKCARQGVHLTDGALAARRLSDAFSGRALEAFQESTHGREVKRIGLEQDLAFCAQVDLFQVVPRLVQTPDARLRLVASDRKQSVYI